MSAAWLSHARQLKTRTCAAAKPKCVPAAKMSLHGKQGKTAAIVADLRFRRVHNIIMLTCGAAAEVWRHQGSERSVGRAATMPQSLHRCLQTFLEHSASIASMARTITRP